MATKIRGICLNFSSDLISRSHYLKIFRNRIYYLGLHSGECLWVCFTEAYNYALSLAISELPKVLMFVTATLIPDLDPYTLTPDISLEGIMIEHGWDVLHNELIRGVAL